MFLMRGGVKKKLFCFFYFLSKTESPPSRFLKTTTAATMIGGPKTFGRTKKLED